LALGALCSGLTADVVDEVRRSAARSLARAACADELCAGELVSEAVNSGAVDARCDAGRWLDAVALRELTRLSAATAHRDRKLAIVLARELADSCAELESLGRSTVGVREAVARCGCALAGCCRDAVVRAGAARLLVRGGPGDAIGAGRLAPRDADQQLCDRVAQSLAQLTCDADVDVSACARP
jgi:hypothetical protein